MKISKFTIFVIVVFAQFLYSQGPISPNLADWRLIPQSVTMQPTDAVVASNLISGNDYSGSLSMAAGSSLSISFKLPALVNGGMFLYSVTSSITDFVSESYISDDGVTWVSHNLSNYNNGRGDDLQKVDIPQVASNKYFRVVFRNNSTSAKSLKDFALYKFNSTGRHQYFVFIGASLTEPTGSILEWKSTINSRLGSAYQPVVFNWALSGANTEQILARVDEFMLQHPNAAYVVLETAGNDITAVRPLTYDRATDNYHNTLFNNMRLLVTKVKGYGKVPVVSRISFRNYSASTSWRGYEQPAVNGGANQEFGSLPYNFFMDKIIKEECPEFYNNAEGRGYLDFYQFTLNNQSILSDGIHIYGSDQNRVREFWVDYGLKYVYTGLRSTVVPYTEFVANINTLANNAVLLAEQSALPQDIWSARILVEQIANVSSRLSLSTRLDNIGISNVAPSVISQPANVSVIAGATATFSVVASGTATLTYQWQKNGINIVGANSSSYSYSAPISDNGATFRCVIANSIGSVTSLSATLSVAAAPTPPSITAQPTALVVTSGATATFNISVSGSAPISFQWQRNNVDISGATSSSYSFVTSTTDNGANFRCMVTNLAGSITSNSVLLTVNAAQTSTGAIKATAYNTSSLYNAGFNTSAYESYTYSKTTGYNVQNLPFRILKPTNYSTETSKKYPMVIMFHGRGEAGTDNNYHLKWGGLEHQTAVQNKVFDGFVVYPQEPYGAWTTTTEFQANGSQPGDALKLSFDLVDSLINKYRIDPNKVYVHGLSSGGTAVWASIYNRPELFAAALPMSSPGDLTQIEKVSTTAIWLFQGREDDNPRPWVSRPVVDAIRNSGAIDPTWSKYSEYPGVAHSTWVNAYLEPDFFPFMLRQDRRQLRVMGTNPFPSNGSVSLGLVSGMQVYEWYKDNTIILGASSHRLNNITQPGQYFVRFKRNTNDLEWNVTNVVTLSNVNVSNPAPVLSVISPTAYTNNTLTPYSVYFYASASDINGSIAKVEFFNGTTLLNTDNSAPYEFNWTSVAAGTYDVVVKATDNLGATTSVTNRIYVGTVSNSFPTVSISTPSSNTSFPAQSTINIVATANDIDGGVAKVDFYINNQFVGSDNTSPYEYKILNPSAGTYSVVAKAIDVRKALTTSAARTITVTSVANQLPIVSLISPVNNAFYSAPGSVLLSASASDPNGTVSNVEFYNGATLLGSDNTAPYTFSWNNIGVGNYQITAKATDNSGGSTLSAAVNIFIINTNQAPTVSITSPLNGASYVSPALIVINANAIDVDGSITRVEFYNGNTLIATDNVAPYSFDWSNVAPGNYQISVKTFDNSGGSSSSSVVNINVVAPNQLPTVSIISPTSGAVFDAMANVNIQAVANDIDGTVSKVEFYDGNTLIGVDNLAPFDFVWTNVGAGNYNLSAKATDNLGGVTVSGSVSISVLIPNQKPSVSITSPSNNSSFTTPTSITINANAIDTDGTIAKVDFYNGAVLLGTDLTSPYSLTLANVAVGNYNFVAKATDNQGAEGISTSVAVLVDVPGNQSPTVSIISPANNSTFISPANIVVDALASDIDGTIKKVVFYNGTSFILGTDSIAPYSFTISNAPIGTYNINARAYDNLGAMATSSTVQLIVSAPNQLPVINITSPINNSSFSAPASVTINASATDTDGSIALVEFYNGNILIGSDASAPYSFTWLNVAQGSYQITAKATDNAGGISVSSMISLTVTAPINQLPLVAITSPVNNSTFASPANITINVSASDPDGTVSSVEFYNGNTLIGTDLSSPYSLIWNNVNEGNYSITAKATDNTGASSVTTPVLISVNVVNNQPVVSITTPSNQAVFDVGSHVAISATASSPGGSISKVDFYNGTNLIGSDNYPPYGTTIWNASSGLYVITAKATDNIGNISVSQVVNIEVNYASTNYFVGNQSCLNLNQSSSFVLNSSLVTSANNYSWSYSGSGVSVVPIVGSNYMATVTTALGATSGDLCVGVNYSVSPFYKKYCKTLSVCNSGARVAEAETLVEVMYINYDDEKDVFVINANDEIERVKLFTNTGGFVMEVVGAKDLRSLAFGHQLQPGLYVGTINLKGNKVESFKIIK